MTPSRSSDLHCAMFVAVPPARAAQLRRDPSKVAALREGRREEVGLAHYWHGVQYLLAGRAKGVRGPLAWLTGGGEELGRTPGGPVRYLTPDQVKQLSAAVAKVEPDDLGDDAYDEAAMDAAGVYPGRWVRSGETFDPLGTMRELYSYLRTFLAKQVKAKNGVAIVMTLEPAAEDDEADAPRQRPSAPAPTAAPPAPAPSGALLLAGASGRRYERVEGKPQGALDATFAGLGYRPLGDIAILPVLVDSVVRTYRADDGKAVAACVLKGDQAASTTFLAQLAKGAVLVVSDAFVLEKAKKRVFATMMSKAKPADLNATLRKRLAELEKTQGAPVVMPAEPVSAAKAWEAWWAKQRDDHPRASRPNVPAPFPIDRSSRPAAPAKAAQNFTFSDHLIGTADASRYPCMDDREPLPLPYCPYPTAGDIARHGVQTLPAMLPLVDFEWARPYRSRRYAAIPASKLTPAQILQLAEVVGTSFALREPQCRHLQPSRLPPPELREALHRDPFGAAAFGPWSSERLLYWFIRLLILTDATSPRSAVRVNAEALTQSLAILDAAGDVIGGALNEPMPVLDGAPSFRQGDPFLGAVLAYVEPVFALLGAQDAEALKALSVAYPQFRDAHAARKVGHHFMVARSDALPKADAFELVAATAAHYRALGYAFMVIEATNQWTGAACETLGGVRVHFAAFRTERLVRRSAEPLNGIVTSPDGFLARKDSGSMLYVIRLA